MEEIGLFAGWHFKPTDEEVLYFLKIKVMGDLLPINRIWDCDVYADKLPWDIFKEHGEEDYIWVFSKLKRNKNSKRVSRFVGGGRHWTWHGENAKKEIRDGKKRDLVLGYKKTFTLRNLIDKKKNKQNTNWIMQEYFLGDQYDDVVCKIKKKTATKGQQQKNYCYVGVSSEDKKKTMVPLISISSPSPPEAIEDFQPLLLDQQHSSDVANPTATMINDPRVTPNSGCDYLFTDDELQVVEPFSQQVRVEHGQANLNEQSSSTGLGLLFTDEELQQNMQSCWQFLEQHPSDVTDLTTTVIDDPRTPPNSGLFSQKLFEQWGY